MSGRVSMYKWIASTQLVITQRLSAGCLRYCMAYIIGKLMLVIQIWKQRNFCICPGQTCDFLSLLSLMPLSSFSRPSSYNLLFLPLFFRIQAKEYSKPCSGLQYLICLTYPWGSFCSNNVGPKNKATQRTCGKFTSSDYNPELPWLHELCHIPLSFLICKRNN